MTVIQPQDNPRQSTVRLCEKHAPESCDQLLKGYIVPVQCDVCGSETRIAFSLLTILELVKRQQFEITELGDRIEDMRFERMGDDL